MGGPSRTKVPEAVDALVGVVRAALVDAGIDGKVFDGPTELASLGQLYVVVGPSTPNADAMRSAADNSTGMGARRKEAVTVTMVFGAWSGSEGFSEKRLRVAGMIGAVDAALQADRHLGGVADSATIEGVNTWGQDVWDRGGVVEASVDVTVTAYL